MVIVPPVQKVPASIVQVELQPSLLEEFPSSHASDACFLPSPHWTVHADPSAFTDVPPVQTWQVSAVVVVPPFQIESVSITQSELHPSESAVFPSSHASEECLRPSPQVATQLDLVASGEVPSVQRVQEEAVVPEPPLQA